VFKNAFEEMHVEALENLALKRMILKLEDEISKFNNDFENFKTKHASLVNENIEYPKDYPNLME